jgi:hypothetical protein
MRDRLADPLTFANDRVPPVLDDLDHEPDSDPLPLEASAADVLDQRREAPMDEEEENHL